MISKSDWGLRFRPAKQNSHLVAVSIVWVTSVATEDTGTREWRTKGKAMPRSCTRLKVDEGIAASCRIPARYRDGQTMFLEIWPRLGDDFVDGSSLPASVRLWTLADPAATRLRRRG